MKLIRRVTLSHKVGSTEKVYEVELCRVASGKFLVNFRYGHKGSVLKEGTKTHRSVAEAKARSIFARLVDDKKRKGYTEAGVPSRPKTSASKGTGQALPVSPGDRIKAIVERVGNQKASRWALSRAVWRAGELRLKEAVPHMVKLVGSGSWMLQYCLAWALGRCGDESTFEAILRAQGQEVALLKCDACGKKNRIPWSRFPTYAASCGHCGQSLRRVDRPLSLAADTIQVLFPASTKHPAVGRMALEAVRAWGGESGESVATSVYESLPEALRKALDKEDEAAFSIALDDELADPNKGTWDMLERLYMLDDACIRPGLLKVLRTVDLKPGAFRALRHIFKLAEGRSDGQVFGLLAHRFERTRGNFRSSRVYTSVHGRWTRASTELAKPDARLCFSHTTREYLRRRTWRTLRRLGELGDAEQYVRMAVGVLLPFTDTDGGNVQSHRRYNYSTRGYTTGYWDKFCKYEAFNRVLFANSHRYERKHPTKQWRCVGGYKPGDAVPQNREEAFPELWDKVPVGLLHLLAESRCEWVHDFAARALRANKPFCDGLDVETITMLLGRGYKPTVRLAFEIAVELYDPRNPDIDLVSAMINCSVPEARQQAQQWVHQDRQRFVEDRRLVADIILSPQQDTRAFAEQLLSSVSLGPLASESLIATVISRLLALEPGFNANTTLAKDASTLLLKVFARPLRSLGLEIVEDLANHKLVALQEFAAQILVAHDVRPRDLPEDLLAAVMNSVHPAVRGTGIRLFGELPDFDLLERKALILALVTSRQEDVRDAIRPVIQRLVGTYREFADELSSLLLATLLRKESHKGLHNYLLRLFQDELLPSLRHIGKPLVLRLLRAPSSAAQELGGLLLARNIDPRELTVREVVRLASHEIRSVREAAWKFYTDNPDRIRDEIEEGIRLLDATWDDSRAFAFDWFGSVLDKHDFDPDILVSICDSVREDVQQFGRRLVTKYFTEQDGHEYLLRLSEHPSADLQVFASNYLEDHASGSLERLRELEPYFRSVLSRVNRGRVAKARVFAFLAAESRKSDEAAAMISELLTRQSLTMAKGDRANCITGMLDLLHKYPGIELPIKVVAPPQRAGRFSNAGGEGQRGV